MRHVRRNRAGESGTKARGAAPRAVFNIGSDVAGEDYRLFLREASERFPIFMLVCRYSCALEIRRELRPLQLKHYRRSRWPGTVLYQDTADLIIYRFDKRALTVLDRPGSLSHWLHPKYPEDLAFFRADKTCAFGSVTHEGDAYILDADFARVLPKRFKLVEETVSESDWKEFYEHSA